MSYRLFLDDIRTVGMVYPDRKESDFVIVRNHLAFKETILREELPDFISFDNDLGLDEQMCLPRMVMPVPNGWCTNRGSTCVN